MRHIAITVLGGVLALLGAAACDTDVDGEALRDADDGDASEGPETPEPEVQSTAGGTGIPDCYPEDAPRPDGQVVSSISFSQDETFVCTLSVEVGELAPAIGAFQSDLVAAGWTLAFETAGESRSFGVSKGEYAMFVAGDPDGGASTMSITVLPSALVPDPPTIPAGGP